MYQHGYVPVRLYTGMVMYRYGYVPVCDSSSHPTARPEGIHSCNCTCHNEAKHPACSGNQNIPHAVGTKTDQTGPPLRYMAAGRA